ncbi:hypothetical protein FHS78_000660 [Parvibaculum indicum]|uniref:hypothetical protein n=1 Tax=Parvibaculum indicum TaxID=562969 RepID=UPI001420D501|nr:hypothetical protein [Parvibaculum indicum]NIJ40390.1 hypothetical protein [Parvibaculum indicum]
MSDDAKPAAEPMALKDLTLEQYRALCDRPNIELFALANMYRRIVEKVVEKARFHRVVYSDSLLRDLSFDLAQIPGENLLSYQPRILGTAPRDGRVVMVITDCEYPVPAKWDDGRVNRMAGWVCAETGTPLHPIAWVPIDMKAARENFS